MKRDTDKYSSMKKAVASGLISASDIASGLHAISTDHKVMRPSGSGKPFILKGRFSGQTLRDGLFLHMSESVQLESLTTSSVLDGGLKLAVVVDGLTDISYGSQRFKLGPVNTANTNVSGQAVLVNLTEPTLCVRRGVAGRYSRAISMTLSPEWMGTTGLAGLEEWRGVARFLKNHLATSLWQPSARSLAQVSQMFSTDNPNTPMRKLYLESRAIDIAWEALDQLSISVTHGRAGTIEGAYLREHRRLVEVCELLDSGEADALSMTAIAAKIGMSASTLQRHFRALHGTTVFDYLRNSRMQRARRALERDGVSVEQAAVIAGYSSAANFATAMRRFYGIRPRDFRSRLK